MPLESRNSRLQKPAPKGCAAFRKPRFRCLTACIASAFALTPAVALAATTRIVNNCDDAGPGSLRAQIGAAQSGDTVDLSTAQLSCSVITLTSGEIAFSGDDLILVGPASRTVTITTQGTNRLLHHTGTSTLQVQNLTFSGGYYVNPDHFGDARGGCIYSNAIVKLTHSVVSGCTAYTYAGMNAKGGGIYTDQWVKLYFSQVVANRAYAFNNSARGGGIFAGGRLYASYSTISANSAFGGALGNGGGAYAKDLVSLSHSTVDSNTARLAAGIQVASANDVGVDSSTISGNQASGNVGGLGLHAVAHLYIENSTIAFNSAAHYAGVYADAFKATVSSSIIAGNSNNQGGFADFYQVNGSWSTSSSLVQSYNNAPASGTVLVTADPQLTPLASHGGPTRTHALLATSPAIGQGTNPTGDLYDQRGAGFSRVVGAAPDIGAYERQVNDDEIFYDGFD